MPFAALYSRGYGQTSPVWALNSSRRPPIYGVPMYSNTNDSYVPPYATPYSPRTTTGYRQAPMAPTRYSGYANWGTSNWTSPTIVPSNLKRALASSFIGNPPPFSPFAPQLPTYGRPYSSPMPFAGTAYGAIPMGVGPTVTNFNIAGSETLTTTTMTTSLGLSPGAYGAEQPFPYCMPTPFAYGASAIPGAYSLPPSYPSYGAPAPAPGGYVGPYAPPSSYTPTLPYSCAPTYTTVPTVTSVDDIPTTLLKRLEALERENEQLRDLISKQEGSATYQAEAPKPVSPRVPATTYEQPAVATTAAAPTRTPPRKVVKRPAASPGGKATPPTLRRIAKPAAKVTTSTPTRAFRSSPTAGEASPAKPKGVLARRAMKKKAV
jgi:hypothetical protein